MTKNNWFTTNNNVKSLTNLCDFTLTIKPYPFKADTFYSNSKRVAKELSELYDNLYIAYSGGLDSQFVLKTFYELGLPIKPIIVDTPFNQYENEWAFNYCKEINVRPEVLSFSKNTIVDKLKEKTIDKGLFSLLGGLPLIVCDEVNKTGGKLLTGYGDPFTIVSGLHWDFPISTRLEFSEWDYYLDAYDNTHPSGFLTYDLALFYSLLDQISYSCPIQQAKHEIYQLQPRMKMFWKEEFYLIFRELKHKIDTPYNQYLEKTVLFNTLNTYIQ